MYKIYKIINKLNNKTYIGQTSQSLKARFQDHCCPSSKCTILRNAIQKYGRDNFDIELVQDNINSIEETSELEISYIKKFDSLHPNGYNLTTGGEVRKQISEVTRKKLSESHKGYVWSEESKQKLSESKKGLVISDEQKLQISKVHKGKKLSEETKQKLSDSKKGVRSSFFGKSHSEETKKKISEAQKLRYKTKQNVEK